MNLSKKSISPSLKTFLETIRIERGHINNLTYHQARFDRTRHFHWKSETLTSINLAEVINAPDKRNLYRCRVIYHQSIESIEYIPYKTRPIHSLQLIQCDEIDYRYKSTDRTLLERCFSERGNADECLIIKDGRITDTSIANVALLKNGIWYTPQTPLLKGTQREYLLANKRVNEKVIRADSIHHYTHIALFNAMIEFRAILLPISPLTIFV